MFQPFNVSKSTVPEFSYSSYYEANETTCTPEEMKMAAADRYPRYFLPNGDINPETLANDLLKSDGKARECFKTLFSMPERFNGNSLIFDCEFLQTLKDKHGRNIIAHGVEHFKGGLRTVLMMCITGKVTVPFVSWGRFADGPPNASPVSHGPYYLIYTVNAKNKPPVRENLDFNQVEYVLVPFEENKIVLREQLGKVLTARLITQQQADSLLTKLITYQELVLKLEKRPAPKQDHDDKENSPKKRSKR